jgi:hypothetical protein
MGHDITRLPGTTLKLENNINVASPVTENHKPNPKMYYK